jgi:hypothetical protein
MTKSTRLQKLTRGHPRWSQKAVKASLASALLAAPVLAAPLAARAQAAPHYAAESRAIVAETLTNLGLEPDLAINSYTTGSQRRPAVAMDADGDFVVAWTSTESSGDDDWYGSVQARLFDSSGTPQGPEFQVNTYTTNTQSTPTVAMDADGDFVIAWYSYGSDGGDTDASSIRARRFNSAGVGQGTEFQVNQYSTGWQYAADIAMDQDGGFIIVWDSEGSSGTDSDLDSVQGRRYNSLGTAQGGEFQLNTYTTSTQSDPEIAIAADGSFVAVWDSHGSAGDDDSSWSIQARRFNSLGTGQGAEFQVNTETNSHQWASDIGMDTDGNFVVVWGSQGGTIDVDDQSVRARLYDETGTPLSDQFLVNTYSTNGQEQPAVAMDSDGDFVVTWRSLGSNGDDSEGWSQQGQKFHKSGTAVNGEFQLNAHTTGDQNYSKVAMDAEGNFIAIWGNGVAHDSDSSGVAGQLFPGQFEQIFLPIVVGD